MTVIVMGNGKSLNDIPKEFLGKYPSFGGNYIYLLPFQPTYYACVDSKILLEAPDQIYDVAKNSEVAYLSDAHQNGNRLYELDNVQLCNIDTIRFPGEKWWTGGTVVYAMLKFAYKMGFTTVLLVGCDRDKNLNHFSRDYPAVYTPPDRRRKQEYHLGVARIAYEKDGRRIVNLSPPSILDEYLERGIIEDYL
jgi:hypothetical protein